MRVLADIFKLINEKEFDQKKEMIVQYLESGGWNFLLETLKNPKNREYDDEDIFVERAAKIFKSIMRNLREDFLVYVPELFREVN